MRSSTIKMLHVAKKPVLWPSVALLIANARREE